MGARGALSALAALARDTPRVARGLALADEARALGRRAARREARAEEARRGGPPPQPTGWHLRTIAEIEAQLATSRERGLDPEEAALRLARDGRNDLPVLRRRSRLSIAASQVSSVPVALLAGSAALSAATGRVVDAAAIVAVIGLNAAIGYATESHAEQTIGSLELGAALRARVRRGGVDADIDAGEVVVGDVLVLLPGALAAADARVIHADGLRIDESQLTGESAPVAKSPANLGDPTLPVADRANMIHRGTLVTGGAGTAVVVATGAATEVGRVQALVGSVTPRETPMQAQLRVLGLQLAMASGAVCVGVFAIGVARGFPVVDMLSTSISLAVAAVPEGLPTVAVTALSLGIRSMRRHDVLIRRMSAVEALGALETMCLDKTGTLTENRMRVVALGSGARSFEVARASFVGPAGPVEPRRDEDLGWLLRAVVLCSEVVIERRGGEGGELALVGTPTERALVQLAMDGGLDVLAIRGEHPLLDMRVRDGARTHMGTLHGREGDPTRLLVVKGNPTEVLAMCGFRMASGEARPLTDARRAQIEAMNQRMADRALRVLGVACLDAEDATVETQRGLVWLGLVGMADPPRQGVVELLERFHRAGIETLMVTGDQSATARAVARQVGISDGDARDVLDATQIEGAPDGELRAMTGRAHVFSRVSPAHKLAIVRALQATGRVVAMTGDGINDGPALRAADVGVALGRGGAAVARQVADVVLQDDDLAAMIGAIEQGRTIYDDIRKAVHFVLATNLSEILLTLASFGAGLGRPLSPMQLLWINLLTDVAPELALAVLPPDGDVLARPPRDPARPMFERDDLAMIALEGAVLTTGALGAYGAALRRHGPGARAGTVAFTSLTFAQLLHALSARSRHHTIFERSQATRGGALSLTVGATLALQIAAQLHPATRRLLGTTPLDARDWWTTGVASIVPLITNEWIKRAALRRRQTGGSLR